MILLVAEKPSVATQHYRAMLERCEGETFTQSEGCLIGKSYCITWCVGHLITLAPFDEYPGFSGPWQLGNLPMLPQKFLLKPIDKTARQLQVVQGLMDKADTIINGADAGREGNLIFDLILDYSPSFKQKVIQRLWVNSYVAKDLDIAWKKLESAEKRVNLSYAARLRQRADWMVGLNATRAYTLTAGQGKLISVGRVQTPTLNLIVQRDLLVENFKEHFFYGVLGTWKGFPSQWIREDKIAFFDEPKLPQSIVDKCAHKPAELRELDIKIKSQFPPKPFDLTELQKEANRRFKINVQQVLDTAQILYEKKVITYPRTDSAYLPDAMKMDSYRLAASLATGKQKELLRSANDDFSFINSEKVTDHFAIIPTGEKPQSLSEVERQIYDLIVERFIMAWLKPNVWSELEARIFCEQEEFRLKLKKPEQEGYKALLKEEKKGKKGASENSEEEITNIVDSLPQWTKGESLAFDPIELYKKKKSKPKYYTEATLLTAMKTAGRQIEDEELAEAMKDRGLGTPATQAGIIETLKKREFVTMQKSNIVSTPRGRMVIGLMDEKVKSPEMTGDWEHKLSLVEKGEYSPVAFRDAIVDYVEQLFTSLRARYGGQFSREKAEDSLQCLKCAQPLKMTPWGYACEAVGCDFRIGHTIAQRALSHEEMKELLSTGKTGVLSGFISKKGSSFSARVCLDEQGKTSFLFENDGKFHGAETSFLCPLCKHSLQENTNAYFCSSDACSFTLFRSMSGKMLSSTDIQELLETGKTKIISGFQSKKGMAFDASLSIDATGKVIFGFSDSRKDENIGLSVPTVFYGRPLQDQERQQLLEQKRTSILEGFVKNDKVFRAAIEIREDGRLGFVLSTVELTP